MTTENKGKVEAGVHYLKRNFCGGRTPTTLTQANADVKEWCLTTAGQREHGTTHKAPLVVFEQVERASLKPLPALPYDLAVWREVKLHRDCYIVFENAFYSAPFRLVGQKLRVRAGSTRVRLYNSNYELIATHTRATSPGERITNQDHLPPYKLAGLNQNREEVQKQATLIGPATGAVVSAMLADKGLDRLSGAARLVQLSRRFGEERLEAACGRAQRYGETDYKTVKGILVRGLERAAAEVANVAGPAPAAPNEAMSPQMSQTNPARRVFARSAEELLGHLFSPVASMLGAVVVIGLGLAVVGRLGGGKQRWN